MKERNASNNRSATAPTAYNKIQIASDISLRPGTCTELMQVHNYCAPPMHFLFCVPSRFPELAGLLHLRKLREIHVGEGGAGPRDHVSLTGTAWSFSLTRMNVIYCDDESEWTWSLSNQLVVLVLF